MRKLLLASVAVLALTASAHAEFFGSSGPTCSGTNSLGALQPILQRNIVDVVTLASPDDPYKVNMDGSHVITDETTPHKADCKILLEFSNKAHPSIPLKKVIDDDDNGDSGFTDDDWITYTVQMTDKGDETFVSARWSATLKTQLEIIKSKAELAKLQKEAAEREAARKAQEAKEEAEAKAKEEAEAKANTVDLTAHCDDGLKYVEHTVIAATNQMTADQLTTTDVTTISPGVCKADMVRAERKTVDHQDVFVYNFAQVPYHMTLSGPKILGNDKIAWQYLPFQGQTLPQEMLHDEGASYFFSIENLFPNWVRINSTDTYYDANLASPSSKAAIKMDNGIMKMRILHNAPTDKGNSDIDVLEFNCQKKSAKMANYIPFDKPMAKGNRGEITTDSDWHPVPPTSSEVTFLFKLACGETDTLA
jgi:hypothetical protein